MGVLPRYVSALSFFLFLSYNAQAQGQNPFFLPPSYSGNGPIATADFNRDGKPDLVSADGTVMLGKGDGTFSAGTTLSVSGQSLNNSRIVATGDFNSDGDPDVLLSTSTNLYIFLGNGDGTFRAPVTTNIGADLDSVVVADVNGDGRPDIIGLASSLIFVLLGKGNGTFGPAVTYPGSNFFSFLSVGDFNGDGKPDIALAAGSGGSAAGTVGVLLGNGDGTFQNAVTSTGVSSPAGIVVADFNRDGKLDLAISDNTLGHGQTFIVLGNGNGTFQAPGSALPTQGLLATVDLNGDGKPDLIVGGNPFVEIFIGKGDGTFTANGAYLGAYSLSATSVVTADFNGDGKPDVATANLVLLGNGDGTLQGDPAVDLGNQGLAHAVTGDFNQDGSLDIAVASANNQSLLNVLLNDGTGKFSLAHTYTLPLPAYSIASADLNADGKLDFVFVTQPLNQGLNINIMLGNGNGTFAPSTVAIQDLPGTSDPAPPLAVVDLNGDHKPDLAVLTQSLNVFIGNGDGTFKPDVTYFAGSGPTSFVTGDFNNDGFADVAVSSSAGLGILLGKGDGTFQSATFPAPEVTQVLAAADLNGDGALDLLVLTSAGLQVLLGKGDGTFEALPPLVNNPRGTVIGVTDVNGDGNLDLILSPPESVLLGNGDGTFGNPVTVLGGCTNLACPLSALLVADFNGDHRPDIAVSAQVSTSGITTLLNISGPALPNFLISARLLSPETVVPGSSASSTVSLAAVGGFNASVTLSCSGLPSGANCSFSPPSLPTGSGTSTLTITTSAPTPLGTYPVLVVGTSSAISNRHVVLLIVATSAGASTASLAPEILTFAQRASGTTSAAQSVALTNTGNTQLAISGIAVGGTNPGDFKQTNTCGSSLAVGASCLISVTFTPAGMATRSAAISVSDNATGSPQIVTLTGTGQDFSLAPSGASSATVTPGQTASYAISMASGGGFNQSVTLTCSGAPAKSTCNVSPSTIALSGTSPVTATVTVNTTASSQVFPPSGFDGRRMTYRPMPFALALLGMMLVIAMFLWRKDQRLRWLPVLAFGTLVCIGMTLTSCGGGSSGGGGGGGSTGTPAGSYTITVSATATSGSTTTTHTTPLTLVVQ